MFPQGWKHRFWRRSRPSRWLLDASVVTGVVVTFRDVSEMHRERHELERAYKEAAKRTAVLDAVIESIPHGVYVATLDGAPMRTNQRAQSDAGPISFQRSLKTLELGARRGKLRAMCSKTQGRWVRSTGAPISARTGS